MLRLEIGKFLHPEGHGAVGVVLCQVGLGKELGALLAGEPELPLVLPPGEWRLMKRVGSHRDGDDPSSCLASMGHPSQVIIAGSVRPVVKLAGDGSGEFRRHIVLDSQRYAVEDGKEGDGKADTGAVDMGSYCAVEAKAVIVVPEGLQVSVPQITHISDFFGKLCMEQITKLQVAQAAPASDLEWSRAEKKAMRHALESAGEFSHRAGCVERVRVTAFPCWFRSSWVAQ